MTSRNRLLFVGVGLLASATAAHAQDWTLMKPSTSGIPGEEVRLVRFAPDGLLWVGARHPFWGEGGIGVLDPALDAWTTYDNVEGDFPSAFPNDTAWAPDGSLWAATGAGLVHRVGGQITLYNAANSPLLHDVVADVDVGPDGHVWLNNSNVSGGPAAIFEFDGTTWTSYEVGDELPWALPWQWLSDVLVDHLGHVWVANDTLNGVAEYDGTRWVLHGAGVGRFGELAEDGAGNIWLRAGVGGGNSFWRFDHTGFKAFPINTTPTSIGIGDDGTVYLGDWGGTVRRSTDFGASFQVWLTGLNHVFEIEPEPGGGDVWIGTQGALGHFRGSGAWVRDYNTWNTGMPDYFVDRFDVDRTGNLWVATGEAGLSRFDGLRWRNWGNHNVGSEPYPFAGNEPMGAFYLDSQGTGWMGGNGIARWDPDTGTFDGFWNWQNNPGMGVTLFEAFAEGPDGALFAVTEYASIYRFDATAQLWVKEPVQPYAAGGLPAVRNDALGNLWVAGWFALHKYDGTAWTVVGDDWGLFDLGGLNDFSFGPDDSIWMATVDGLLVRDGTSNTLYTPANSPMPAAAVRSVAFRDDGLFAMSTSDFGAVTPFPSGVCVVDGDIADPANWSVYSYGSTPIPHYQLGRVIFDGQGNLWISATSEGCTVLMHPSQPLASDRDMLSAADGGQVQLDVDAGIANGGRLYAVLLSLSGTEPGLPLPGGQAVLPLVWDPFTDLGLELANTPAFANFIGFLDGAGQAQATLDTLGALPAAAGFSIHLAMLTAHPFGFASNPITISFSP